MSVVIAGSAGRPDRRGRLLHQLRILRVIALTEYKLKYAESSLGYVWSVAKPLAMFGDDDRRAAVRSEVHVVRVVDRNVRS